MVSVDYTTWGWVHLIVGPAAVAAGFGLMQGRSWGRILAVGLAVLSEPRLPLRLSIWCAIVIAFDVLVIYALTVHWYEVRD